MAQYYQLIGSDNTAQTLTVEEIRQFYPELTSAPTTMYVVNQEDPNTGQSYSTQQLVLQSSEQQQIILNADPSSQQQMQVDQSQSQPPQQIIHYQQPMQQQQQQQATTQYIVHQDTNQQTNVPQAQYIVRQQQQQEQYIIQQPQTPQTVVQSPPQKPDEGAPAATNAVTVEYTTPPQQQVAIQQQPSQVYYATPVSEVATTQHVIAPQTMITQQQQPPQQLVSQSTPKKHQDSFQQFLINQQKAQQEEQQQQQQSLPPQQVVQPQQQMMRQQQAMRVRTTTQSAGQPGGQQYNTGQQQVRLQTHKLQENQLVQLPDGRQMTLGEFVKLRHQQVQQQPQQQVQVQTQQSQPATGPSTVVSSPAVTNALLQNRTQTAQSNQQNPQQQFNPQTPTRPMFQNRPIGGNISQPNMPNQNMGMIRARQLNPQNVMQQNQRMAVQQQPNQRLIMQNQGQIIAGNPPAQRMPVQNQPLGQQRMALAQNQNIVLNNQNQRIGMQSQRMPLPNQQNVGNANQNFAVNHQQSNLVVARQNLLSMNNPPAQNSQPINSNVNHSYREANSQDEELNKSNEEEQTTMLVNTQNMGGQWQQRQVQQQPQPPLILNSDAQGQRMIQNQNAPQQGIIQPPALRPIAQNQNLQGGQMGQQLNQGQMGFQGTGPNRGAARGARRAPQNRGARNQPQQPRLSQPQQQLNMCNGIQQSPPQPNAFNPGSAAPHLINNNINNANNRGGRARMPNFRYNGAGRGNRGVGGVNRGGRAPNQISSPNYGPPSEPSSPNAEQERQTAKMLVLLENGEQRLITFSLPKESCTVMELLEQVNVEFTPGNIQCVRQPGYEIEYYVTVGSGGQNNNANAASSGGDLRIGGTGPTPPPTPPQQQQRAMVPPPNAAVRYGGDMGIQQANSDNEPPRHVMYRNNFQQQGQAPTQPPQQPQSQPPLQSPQQNQLLQRPPISNFQQAFSANIQQQQLATKKQAQQQPPPQIQQNTFQYQLQQQIQQQQRTTETSTPQPASVPSPEEPPEEPEREASPPKEVDTPKYVPGHLAVCNYCGYTSVDFNKCQRCKRKLPEDCKSIPLSSFMPNAGKKSDKNTQHTGKISLSLNSKTGSPDNKNLKHQDLLNKLNSNLTITKTLGKGRRGKQKVPEAEPEILTLSSDEEDNEENSKPQENDAPAEQIDRTTLKLSEKEPFITEEDDVKLEDESEDENADDEGCENSGPTNDPEHKILLNCKTIRIGTYKCVPKKPVLITQRGIQICVPPKSEPERECTLNFVRAGIVKILIHFGNELPVMFVYALPSLSRRVCKLLGMDLEGSEPDYFYCSTAQSVSHRRVAILPVEIPEDAVEKIKEFFAGKLDLLTRVEANDILSKIISHDEGQLKKFEKNETNEKIKKDQNNSQLSLSSSQNSVTASVVQLLIYPKSGKGGISINTEDYACLATDQFLNDVIIDFYLKYLVENCLPEDIRQKTHVFSSFFYKRLTCKPQAKNRRSSVQPYEMDPAYTPAQRRHMRVKRWTRNLNLFEKDYIIIPINESSHWFLAIICFPGMEGCRRIRDDQPIEPKKAAVKGKKSQVQIGNTIITQVKKEKQPVAITLHGDDDPTGSDRDEAEGEDSELEESSDSSDEKEPAVPAPVAPEVEEKEKKKERTPREPREPVKQPCILIFDSLAGGTSRTRVVATLRDYLTWEHRAKFSSSHTFTKYNMRGHCPKVPQQNNFTDCGLYLLQYVESFFINPINDYNIPIKHLKDWFEEIVVTRKREELSALIRDLMSEYGLDVSKVPDVKFPTINGILIEDGYDHCEDEEEDDEELMDESEAMLAEEEAEAAAEAEAECDESEPEVEPEEHELLQFEVEQDSQIQESISTDLFYNKTKRHVVRALLERSNSQSKVMMELDSDSKKRSASPMSSGESTDDGPNVPSRILSDSDGLESICKNYSDNKSNRDTMSYLKAKRIIRHKNADSSDSSNSPCKKQKIDTS